MNAAESDFICNLSTCRRQVVNTGWVTSCSHIFCEEDGQEKLRHDGPVKCPVCESSLQSKYDIVHVNLNPSEEYKSMVLAGMRPEVALEIASRAVSFWAYQMYSERCYQERAARKVTTHMENIQTEMSKTLKKTEDLEKENEVLHLKVQELRDVIADRGRQLQKAQTALSLLRRETVMKSSESRNVQRSDGISPRKAPSIGSPTEDIFTMEQTRHNCSLTPKSTSSDPGFSFRPNIFPDNGRKPTVPPFTLSKQ